MLTLAVSIPHVALHANFAHHTNAHQSNQTDKFKSDPRGGGWAGGVVGSACIGSAAGVLARADCTFGRRLGVSA